MALRLNLALGLALSVSSTVALRVTLFRSSPALAGQYTHLRKPQVSFSRHSIQAAHLPAGGVSTPDPSGASLLLALTIALEVIATTCMKMTMKSNLWYCGVALGYGLCFTVFPLVLRRMPLATVSASLCFHCSTQCARRLTRYGPALALSQQLSLAPPSLARRSQCQKPHVSSLSSQALLALIL